MLPINLFVLGVTVISSAFACELTGDWASSCENPEMIEMDDDMKNAILSTHNKLRNDIALGKVEHYDQAANMATIQWDDDLAANAALNVHQCEMEHDDCMNTAQFQYAGQNLAMSMTSEEADKSPDQIASMAAGWFDEQKQGGKYGWMDLINKFTTVGSGDYVVGHFTQFVWASAHKVGCAVSTSKTNQDGENWNATWLACDYSYGNMQGEPVYIAGAATSKCQTGQNNDYPGLCSTDETYDN